MQQIIENGVRQFRERDPSVSTEMEAEYRDFLRESYAPTLNLALDQEGKLLFASSFDLEGSPTFSSTQLEKEMVAFLERPLCQCGQAH